MGVESCFKEKIFWSGELPNNIMNNGKMVCLRPGARPISVDRKAMMS